MSLEVLRSGNRQRFSVVPGERANRA